MIIWFFDINDLKEILKETERGKTSSMLIKLSKSQNESIFE
jgi:hypothetical protein